MLNHAPWSLITNFIYSKVLLQGFESGSSGAVEKEYNHQWWIATLQVHQSQKTSLSLPRAIIFITITTIISLFPDLTMQWVYLRALGQKMAN